MNLGVDVSTWQGEMNWAKAEEAGAEFAFIRAGSINNESGTPYFDYQLSNNIANCHLPRGFYWYFRPNHSPVKQAEFFVELVGDQRNDLGLVCDIETSGGPLPGEVQNRLQVFLEHLQWSGHNPLIYTRASFWRYAVGNPSWAANYPLWIARYVTLGDEPTLDGPWADGKFDPVTWDQWEFWQFSADRPNPGNQLGERFGAEGGSIDLNVSRLPIGKEDQEDDEGRAAVDITQELAQARAALDSIEAKVS